MSSKRLFALCLFFFCPPFHGELSAAESPAGTAPPSKTVPEVVKAAAAAGFADEIKTVEGKVASASFIPNIKGHPTFIDLEKPHPNGLFTIVVWGHHRGKFADPPEKILADKTIRVTGKILLHKNKPQIVVTDPAQIAVLGDAGFKPMATAEKSPRQSPGKRSPQDDKERID